MSVFVFVVFLFFGPADNLSTLRKPSVNSDSSCSSSSGDDGGGSARCGRRCCCCRFHR